MTPSLEGKRCDYNSFSKAAITNKPQNLTGLMQKAPQKQKHSSSWNSDTSISPGQLPSNSTGIQTVSVLWLCHLDVELLWWEEQVKREYMENSPCSFILWPCSDSCHLCFSSLAQTSHMSWPNCNCSISVCSGERKWKGHGDIALSLIQKRISQAVFEFVALPDKLTLIYVPFWNESVL